LIAPGPPEDLTQAEALRVCRPGAKVWLGDQVLTKAAPAGVDDWSHPYHRADNNPLSRDRVIRAPYLTQFLADPRYAPLPQVAVASAGRVFKAFGHIAFKEREEPLLDTLAAFNGYNGTLLWKRAIPPAIMVHRNTLIATPDRLYYGDDKSCKVYAAASGELRDEIAPPADLTGGTFWKWMALEDGVLYALVGEQEQRDPVIKLRWDKHGWPWDPLSPGFNQPRQPWGYGRTLIAIDPQTKRILWRHQEAQAMDSRALCMKSGRLYAFRFGAYLACLDAKTGKALWRRTKDNEPALFDALGPYLDRQDWRTNWRTTAYLKCTDDALYFAGPSVGRLVGASTRDGHLLWQHPYGNYQLVVRADGVFGISGQIDTEVSRKFEPLTGKILDEIQLGRRACTRPTGCEDAIFFRAGEGSVRLDTASDRPGLVSPMRAQCHDGVTIANGLLYWWPSTCDCNLTLYGISALGPAGDFNFTPKATDAERLQTASTDAPSALALTPADWPTFRADNTGSTGSQAALAANASQLWETTPNPASTPTPPTAAGNLVFLSGSDGIVRALSAADGKPVWTAYTGGGVRYPPTIASGRAYVGSGDGWAYAFDAQTGRLLWRFRAAPAERRIPVYGQLLSTWPAASGVLVQDGTAYIAAGIVNYDGTYVYALEAETGRLKWQNNTSGHLDPEARTGVSVQGHFLFHQNALYLAGGNAVSPAIFDPLTGQCRNDPQALTQMVNNNVPAALAPRGAELFRVENQVLVSGKPFYSHPQYPVFDASVINKALVASTADRDFLWINNARVLCVPRIKDQREERLLTAWRRGRPADVKPLWETPCEASLAFALCRNAVLVATPSRLTALSLESGTPLWTQVLSARPVPWGLAVDRSGRVMLTLEDGRVIGIGAPAALALQ
jgi:outer membrane protein assembly factor BamB